MSDKPDRPVSASAPGDNPGAPVEPESGPPHPFRPREEPPAAAESVVWTGRTSWKHFAGSFALWFVGSIVVIWLAVRYLEGKSAFWTAFVPVVGGFLVVFFRGFLVVFGSLYRLTDERLFVERGVLSRTIDQTELIRVDDVRIHKSFFDRMLGIGTVELLSTDQTDRLVRIEGISLSSDVAEAVRSQMKNLRKRSIYMENL
jgi:uncharacterized membrane protein YdbT with pleckstrin-like domain